jgi:hypothetical protein
VVLGACLKAFGYVVRCRTEVIGAEVFQEVGAAIEDAEVRAKELVRRADEDIYVEVLHVYRTVGA